MTNFPIKRGDHGADVVKLQAMLNRRGALLDDDGLFGGGSERAVDDAERDFGLPVTGVVDSSLWDKLAALPEPCASLPTQGVTFIAREEIGSRDRYDQVYSRPCWPGGESGVTIGIGYDLKFVDAARLASEWSLLPPTTRSILAPVLGKAGSRALANSVAAAVIPFIDAWGVFTGNTLPSYVNKAVATFPGCQALPPLCKSALISLVYNRGFSLDGDRRLEMKAIHDLIANNQWPAVPVQFEAMKRLWPNTRGLRDRRDREANLWREGLKAA